MHRLLSDLPVSGRFVFFFNLNLQIRTLHARIVPSSYKQHVLFEIHQGNVR